MWSDYPVVLIIYNRHEILKKILAVLGKVKIKKLYVIADGPKNNKNDILFIYRNNIWDLPKGRIEKNESIETAAIREVEEECSIFNLTIEKQLIRTYHIYFQNKNKLKLTYWFLMNSNYNKPLIPQIEEGLTKVEFIKEKSIDTILKESYANIRLVYDYYKDN